MTTLAVATSLIGLTQVGCGDDTAPGDAAAPAVARPVAPPPEPAADETPPAVFELRAGEPATRRLGPGETHVYRVPLRAGDFLHAAVEQRGVDVVAILFAPDGVEILRGVDRPFGPHGEEPLLAVVESEGEHRLQIAAFKSSPAGEYEIRVVALRSATDDDRARAAAAWEYAAAEALRRGGEYEAAIARQRRALGLWEAVDDGWWRAECLNRIGRGHEALDSWEAAADAYLRASDLIAGLDPPEPRWRAYQLSKAGQAWRNQGELDRAEATFRRALAVAREAGDNAAVEAASHSNLGDVHQLLGRAERAIEHYREALRLWPETRGADAGVTRHNLGVLYAGLGDDELALRHLSKAEEILARAGSPVRTSTLNQLGRLHRERGAIEEALPLLREARDLRRERASRRGLAATLSELGRVEQALGRREAALDSYRQALEILESLDRPRSRAKTLRYLGSLYGELGRHGEAEDVFRAALELDRRLQEPAGEAASLAGVAGAARGRGDLDAAREAYEQALEIAESLRTRILAPSLRAAYFATVQRVFEGYVEVLMAQHGARPDAGYDGRALAAAERARARSLLDLLAAAGAATPSAGAAANGADDDERRRLERALETEIDRRADERRRLLALLDARGEDSRDGRVVAARLAAEEGALRELLLRLEELRAGLDDGSRGATLARPASLTEIQTQLAPRATAEGAARSASGSSAAERRPRSASSVAGGDAAGSASSGGAAESPRRSAAANRGSLLLVYRLGAERSFLWLVDDGSLESFELAPRAAIEEAARVAYRRLLASHDPPAAAATANALCELARLVLAPVAGRLDRERLLIVADGALEYVPFAALPVPDAAASSGRCTGAAPLLEEHAISYLPSASALVVLRRQLADRPPAAGLIAVVADPVFTAADERLGNGGVVTRAAGPGGDESEDEPAGVSAAGRLARLPHTRREAEAILALAPPASRLAALGFDATEERVKSGELAGYRHLHLATHGRLDARRPELSGLFFSRVDRRGRPIADAELRLHEIYALELNAELVTLSACQTALGREIRGEGLWGLTRGFLHAGAARVVVSLWSVADASTAELMASFYRGLLVDELPPAAALRAAQRALRAEARWSAPYHWAGFILHGEPRGGPATEAGERSKQVTATRD